MNKKIFSALVGIAMLCGMGTAYAQTPLEVQQAILESQQQLLEQQGQLAEVQILLGEVALALDIGADEFNPNADELLIAAGVDVQALLEGVTEGTAELVDDVLASVGAFLDGLGDGQ